MPAAFIRGRFLRFALVWPALLLAGGCAGGREEAPPEPVTFSHADWAEVLAAVVTEDGYVRHDAVRDDPTVRRALDRYITRLGQAGPATAPALFPDASHKLAYAINAYNALALYGVHRQGLPPNVLLADPTAPGALFAIEQFRLDGRNRTLASIELNDVLLASGRDPRVHFALNDMARSSPPLLREPYAGEGLEEQLAAQAKRYLADARAVKPTGPGTVGLNSLLTRFHRPDFEVPATQLTPGGLLPGIRRFADADSPLHKATAWQDMGFDWSLNRPPEAE